MAALRTAFGLVSPGGKRGRLTILIFHRVLPAPDPLLPGEPDAARFDEVVGWLTDWFNVLPLDDAVRRLASGDLPARAAAITFDDGYADNHDVALPVLRHHGAQATFFIATAFLDGGCMWNDRIITSIRSCKYGTLDLDGLGLGRHLLDTLANRRAAIDSIIRQTKYLAPSRRDDIAARVGTAAGVESQQNLMLTRQQLRALRAAGMQIGVHTDSHPILAQIPLEAARKEIADCRYELEEILGEPVSLFAYPNGRPGIDYLPEHVRMVREMGFAGAVSTSWGTADGSTDLMQLPRFTPWDRTRARFGLRLLANLRRSQGNDQ